MADMSEFQPYFTNDGSVGLYNGNFDDIYHSATGALTESYEKFIYPLDFNSLLKKDDIKILDICYGIGYNSKSFLNFILKNSSKTFAKQKHYAPIYTDNNYDSNCNNYNDKIYTDNKNSDLSKKCVSGKFIQKEFFCKNSEIKENDINPKNRIIEITAVDSDANLALLSPFIKTGEKHPQKYLPKFNYEKIKKYLFSDKNVNKPSIDSDVNYILLKNLFDIDKEIFDKRGFIEIINDKSYRPFFTPEIRLLFQFCQSYRLNNLYKLVKHLNLHNIYYRYITKRYKKALKSANLGEIKIEYKFDDARKIIKSDSTTYDVVFLDAFTPSKCPCLWTVEFFKEIFEHMDSGGMLLTYSMSASVRSAMIEAGFYIGNNFSTRENKNIGTIAVKNPSLIKYPLSEFDLGLLKTKAGIFYRDENLTAQNDAIIKAHKIEVENSDKISRSQYVKQNLNR